MTILGMVAIIAAVWKILTILGRVTFLGMVTILRVVTIIEVVTIRAYHKSKISLNFFGTCIFSWVCIYVDKKIWFWRIFWSLGIFK